MKKFMALIIATTIVSGCAPGLPGDPVYDKKISDAKRSDAEFEQAVKNIDLNAADVGSEPKNYKKLIEDAIRENLKDPDSAKFYDFTPPRKEVMVENKKFVYGYSSCVFVNAKNSYGGYTGKKLYWTFIRDNKVLRIQDANSDFGNLIFIGRNINCN
ncbi:hypothetical protein EI752_27295 [Salmonella enterica]|nr:hypothetical protein [Salmonella enterica]